MIAKAFGIGVGEGNRLMRGFNSFHGGAMPDVRQVDEDPQSVHLLYHL